MVFRLGEECCPVDPVQKFLSVRELVEEVKEGFFLCFRI
jgi:hypothetical protein